jgi:ribosome maturation factor RimP
MKQMKGTIAVPFFFIGMANETIIQTVTGFIEELLAGQTEIFLVDFRIKPTHNLKIFLDADQGLSIDKCVSLNRRLYKMIEEAGMFPEGDFSLEVSSPGLDEPLKQVRQYHKNIGRAVEVTQTDLTKLEGKLLEVTEVGITIESSVGKNKKKELVVHAIPFDHIKTTKIQVVF